MTGKECSQTIDWNELVKAAEAAEKQLGKCITTESSFLLKVDFSHIKQSVFDLMEFRKSCIECVHLTSSNSQIQNKRATKGFILIRHKSYQIYTCLQLSSSIASFAWKPAHVELRSYGGA